MPLKSNLFPGQRFERLTVIEEAPMRGRFRNYRCACDCGSEITAQVYNLLKGNTRSCGCLQRENTRAAKTTHGQTDSRLYHVWCGMLTRCRNPNGIHWAIYGGRGIKVCAGWESFETFHADMGDHPPTPDDWKSKNPYWTLDRIDNDGNYSCGHCDECLRNHWPSNVRWASYKEQSVSKRYLGRVYLTKPRRQKSIKLRD